MSLAGRAVLTLLQAGQWAVGRRSGPSGVSLSTGDIVRGTHALWPPSSIHEARLQGMRTRRWQRRWQRHRPGALQQGQPLPGLACPVQVPAGGLSGTQQPCWSDPTRGARQEGDFTESVRWNRLQQTAQEESPRDETIHASSARDKAVPAGRRPWRRAIRAERSELTCKQAVLHDPEGRLAPSGDTPSPSSHPTPPCTADPAAGHICSLRKSCGCGPGSGSDAPGPL